MMHITQNLVLFTIFIFASNFLITLQDDPDKVDYCAQSPTHSCCKRKGPAPSADCTTGQLDNIDDFRQKALDWHNTKRDITARKADPQHQKLPPASNMNVLQYDLNLEYTAWCNAVTCIMSHDDHAQRNTEGFEKGKTGQNLAWGAASDKPHDPIYLMDQWYEKEIDLTSPQDISAFAGGGSIGHFTQVVWGCATHVGCAVSTWKDRKGFNTMVACNYGTTAKSQDCLLNGLGSPVYKQGQACSECPEKCGSKYAGLCGDARSPPSGWKPAKEHGGSSSRDSGSSAAGVYNGLPQLLCVLLFLYFKVY